VNAVDVRVRASPGLINSLDAGTIRATIDLVGAEEGERIVQLAPDQIQAPQGFRVVKITPSILTLNLERTLRKAIPVRPRLIGRPAAGFEVAEITSDPAEVRVAGPRSRVQEIESAFTEPISVEGADTTATELVNVGLEDPLLRLEGGSRVRVTAAVREAREMRSFEGLRVVARGRPARLAPSRVTVSVAGPASQVRGLAPGDLQPYVALPRDGAVPPRLPVAVEIASGRAGISVLETRPAEVSVRVLREGSPP
jgi:YbbR domain-containing protein